MARRKGYATCEGKPQIPSNSLFSHTIRKSYWKGISSEHTHNCELRSALEAVQKTLDFFLKNMQNWTDHFHSPKMWRVSENDFFLMEASRGSKREHWLKAMNCLEATDLLNIQCSLHLLTRGSSQTDTWTPHLIFAVCWVVEEELMSWNTLTSVLRSKTRLPWTAVLSINCLGNWKQGNHSSNWLDKLGQGYGVSSYSMTATFATLFTKNVYILGGFMSFCQRALRNRIPSAGHHFPKEETVWRVKFCSYAKQLLKRWWEAPLSPLYVPRLVQPFLTNLPALWKFSGGFHVLAISHFTCLTLLMHSRVAIAHPVLLIRTWLCPITILLHGFNTGSEPVTETSWT